MISKKVMATAFSVGMLFVVGGAYTVQQAYFGSDTPTTVDFTTMSNDEFDAGMGKVIASGKCPANIPGYDSVAYAQGPDPKAPTRLVIVCEPAVQPGPAG